MYTHTHVCPQQRGQKTKAQIKSVNSAAPLPQILETCRADSDAIHDIFCREKSKML